MNITAVAPARVAAPSTVFEQLAAGDRFKPLPNGASVGVKVPFLPGVTYPWRATGTIDAADAASVSWNEVPAAGEPTQLSARIGLRNLGGHQMQVTFTPTGFGNVQLPTIDQPMQIVEQTATRLELRGGLGAYASIAFEPAAKGAKAPLPLEPNERFKGTMSVRLGAGGGFGPTLTMQKAGMVVAPR